MDERVGGWMMPLSIWLSCGWESGESGVRTCVAELQPALPLPRDSPAVDAGGGRVKESEAGELSGSSPPRDPENVALQTAQLGEL